MTNASSTFDSMMERAGMSSRVRSDFARMYADFCCGNHGMADWSSIAPPNAGDVVTLVSVKERFAGGTPGWSKLAWVVLNGGLGTSMKMEKAKSLLPVRDGRSFLDLLCSFVLKLRERTSAPLPLLFMNSAVTRADTLLALKRWPMEVSGIPLDFEQHLYPRVRLEDRMPLGEADERSSWAPPGHGDFYSAIYESGVLAALLDGGFRWVFVSNADNLGASPDGAILSWLEEEGIEFALEVTPKTAADVKGGSLVRAAGRLSLLEIAQVEPERIDDFQDIEKFPAFNTNNLWLNLEAVKRVVESGGPRMPLIVNRKAVNGVEVVQLEHAIGAAVSSFSRASGLLVPRSRFAPVKTVDDLVVRMSDCYVEGEASPLEPSPYRQPSLGPPRVTLDRAWFESAVDLEIRMPHPLSLVEARSLAVRGDVRFGKGVKVLGDALVANGGSGPLFIPDGQVLGGAA